MDYNDDVWGNNDWGGFQSGDTYVDDSGAKYIYTGTNWGQFDTGGMDSGGANVSSGGDTNAGGTSIAIPDGNVDANGNPTYVNEAGAPVKADGTPILSANARTALDGGGFKTINPNGSVTYEDPDGQVYTVNPNGTYRTAAGTYDPKTGVFTDNSGKPNSGLASVMNSLKSAFQKKDASGKPTGEYDWAKLAGMGAALYGAFGGDEKDTNTYKGKIPSLSATRKQIEYDDPNRRAGSGGRQYFTDTQYTAKGAEAAGKSISDAQAEGIKALYTKAAAPTDKWAGNPTTPALATPWQKSTTGTTGTTSAASTATDFETPAQRAAKFGAAIPEAIKFPERAESEVLSNLRQGNIGSSPTHLGLGFGEGINMNNNNPNYSIGDANQTVTKAQGGILEAAKGRYLRGMTDGMADQINTSIDNKQPAKLSHGEFVVPADVVSHLGNGNSDAGAKKLYSMMDKVRQARTGTKKQGKQINPDKYMPGGTVNKYAAGGIAQLPIKKFNGSSGSTVTTPAGDSTTSGALAPWAGDYVTNMLGQGQALANQPYQAYKGPLTAGASDLQNQAFSAASNLASTGYSPTTFNTGTFDTTAAQKYMNPYLSTALDPQLKELQRQSDIQRLGDSARLAKAGAFGGGRQAIMESEARRNLLDKQAGVLGTGYKNAYDAAMQQFNADQNRGLDTQKASEQSRQYGADFGIKSLNELQESGATQRAIESEGIAADKAQFEEQRDWPYKMVQYQQGLLQGLPISAQTNTPNMTALTSLLASLGYGTQLTNQINAITR